MDQNVSTLHQPGAGAGTDAGPELVEHVWDSDTLKQIAKYGELIAGITKKREALNTQKAAGKAALVEIGFNKESLTAALSYANTPEKDRLNWDESYIFARKALGCPLQEDLFVAAMADTVTVEVPKAKENAPV